MLSVVIIFTSAAQTFPIQVVRTCRALLHGPFCRLCFFWSAKWGDAIDVGVGLLRCDCSLFD